MTDFVLTNHAGRIRLRHRLHRLPRYSKALDRLGPTEPWDFAEVVGDPYRDGHLDLGVRERGELGRVLAVAG